MTKRVLDVGNCVPDHAAIRTLLERTFGAEVVQTHGPDDTLAELKGGKFNLVLVNRKLDQDYSDGLDIVKSVKADASLAKTPVMLITNYEDHQSVAVAAGAEPGFGKLSLNTPQTLERLGKFLR
jgi:CheY-like chemotaxis protein